MENLIPHLNLPVNILANSDITKENLEPYSDFLCKIKASIFALCTRGKIRATINLSEFTIQKHDFIIILPNSFIQIHEISDDIRLSLIGFSSRIASEGGLFKTILDSYKVIFSHPTLPLSDKMASFIVNTISSWTVINELPEISANEAIIKDVMNTFLHTSLSLYESNKPSDKLLQSKAERVRQEFMQLVMQYYLKERRVSFYANKIGVSVENLCRISKTQLHKTPLEIISLFLVMDAKTQLRSTQYSVKDIALILGFPDSSSFCKLFRKYVGMSPLEYRSR